MCASDCPCLCRKVNPSPPPSAPTNGNNPCFPSSSIVTKADGTPSRIDALKEGDEIVAATHDGTIGTDTVSLLSIAKPEAEATFVSLVTDANVTISLTPGHHLPIGESCCSSLKTAKDVQLGEKVWAVEAGAIVARTVAKKQLVKDKGLQYRGGDRTRRTALPVYPCSSKLVAAPRLASSTQ